MKASLGYESSSGQTEQSGAPRSMRVATEEDIASEITRETRNSAISNDFGPSSISGSSQGRFEKAISSE